MPHAPVLVLSSSAFPQTLRDDADLKEELNVIRIHDFSNSLDPVTVTVIKKISTPVLPVNVGVRLVRSSCGDY